MFAQAIEPMPAARTLARWSALAVFAALAIEAFHDALFSGWIASGPPSEFKQGSRQRSRYGQIDGLGWTIAGWTAFVAIPRLVAPGSRNRCSLPGSCPGDTSIHAHRSMPGR